MANKMPREIWLQAPIDTPEIEWKGNEDITWCWHPVDGNDGPDTKYIRADTCTPNEKLGELIGHWKSVRSNYGEDEKEHEVYTLVLARLREVMK